MYVELYAKFSEIFGEKKITYFIINATRVKRYKGYRKVKNILKQFKEEYNLTEYEDVIKNRATLSRVEFFDFIREVNKMKVEMGIIPFKICEYLICEMLNHQSVISRDFEFWADLRECIFCDFISHIQNNQYKVTDYFNYSKRLEEIKENHNYKEKTICIDENIIYNFRNINVKAINVIMHEFVHFEQYFL